MLKEKILQTINNNQAYRDIKQTSSDDVEIVNDVNICSLDLTEEVTEQPSLFKDVILQIIKTNRYFQHVIGHESSEPTDNDNLMELAKFASIDNKVIMSADGKLIAPQH